MGPRKRERFFIMYHWFTDNLDLHSQQWCPRSGYVRSHPGRDTTAARACASGLNHKCARVCDLRHQLTDRADTDTKGFLPAVTSEWVTCWQIWRRFGSTLPHVVFVINCVFVFGGGDLGKAKTINTNYSGRLNYVICIPSIQIPSGSLAAHTSGVAREGPPPAEILFLPNSFAVKLYLCWKIN